MDGWFKDVVARNSIGVYVMDVEHHLNNNKR